MEQIDLIVQSIYNKIKEDCILINKKDGDELFYFLSYNVSEYPDFICVDFMVKDPDTDIDYCDKLYLSYSGSSDNFNLYYSLDEKTRKNINISNLKIL